MYGKIIGYHVEKNKVMVAYEQITAVVEAVTPSIINISITAPKTETSIITLSMVLRSKRFWLGIHT